MDQITEFEASSGGRREEVLFDLLRQTTTFYEDTIGIFSGIFRLQEFVRKGSPEEDFYAYVVNVLIEESKCKNASLFMVSGDQLVLKAASGSHNENTNKHVRIALGQGVAGKCAQEGRHVLVSDTERCAFFERRPDTRVPIGSMLCVPIKEGDRVVGVLNLSHAEKNFFHVHDVRMFELLGLLVGQMLTLLSLYGIFSREYNELQQQVHTKETTLREISTRYKAVVDSTEEMILLIEQDTVIFSNQALSARLQRQPFTLEDIFDAESLQILKTQMDDLAEGEARDFDVGLVLVNASSFICQCSVKRIMPDQILLILKDVTLKKRIEQRSMQTEKLTSLGLLTSGIAHELNNKLTPILGFADLIDTSYLTPRDRERFTTLMESADSARNIVGSLLTFSRNLPPAKTVFDIREIIDRTMNLYKPTIKKRGIKIMHEISQAPLVVRADMNCMEQVMVNLINNSIDAIGNESGNIIIRSFIKGGSVHIQIEDTGPGILDEVMPKVFDPFFTTKSVDKGTGLGLSICYGIITDHRGEISLENTDHGTLAIVKIPAVEKGEDRVRTPQGHEMAECCLEEMQGGDDPGTIMVVEDEEDLLDLMADALGPYYSIRSFRNGREAYEHLDEHEWELIISDLRMPVMDGMELYREVVSKKPCLQQRFLFITGDTYDLQVKEFFDRTGATFIRKPFRVKELQGIVHEEISRLKYRMIRQ